MIWHETSTPAAPGVGVRGRRGYASTMRTLIPWLLLACSCDDHVFEDEDGAPVRDAVGFCAVLDLISSQCLNCHSNEARFGGLDLETDPHGRLVGDPSALYPGEYLVIPGDPDGSLLIQKLTGQQGANGDVMPPGSTLSTAVTDPIVQWVGDGADDVCDEPPPAGSTQARAHTPLWAAPTEHGLAAAQQTYTDCRECHGVLLDGDRGPSCDTCHQGGGAAWRTDCVFCHGGDATDDGAPPADVDAAAPVGFPGHTVHVTQTIHAAWDCAQCHAVPQDVLTPGHLFDDDTPGVAEVDLSGGLSPLGLYNGSTCTDAYCHGDGQTNGTASVAGTGTTCDTCHASTGTATQLSGQHSEHLSVGLACADCHGLVVDAGMQIVDPTLHVQGQIDLALPVGVVRTGGTCTGSCHGEGHGGETWAD